MCYLANVLPGSMAQSLVRLCCGSIFSTTISYGLNLLGGEFRQLKVFLYSLIVKGPRMFSLESSRNSRGIAVVSGGQNDSQIIYFNPDGDEHGEKSRTNFRDMKLTGSEGIIQPLPNVDPSQRDIFIVAAGSGCGKSTYAGQIMKHYQIMFPDRPLFILSKVSKDPSIDDLELKHVNRIALDDTFLEGKPLGAENFRECLVLFDDVETLSGNLYKAVAALRDDLMQCGRHTETTLVATYHLLMDKLKTKVALLEGTQFTIWPKNNTRQCMSFLMTYCGMNTACARYICELPSRHITIIKALPNIIITTRGIMRMTEIKALAEPKKGSMTLSSAEHYANLE